MQSNIMQSNIMQTCRPQWSRFGDPIGDRGTSTIAGRNDASFDVHLDVRI